MYPYVWLNGRVVSREDAAVSATSPGALYGLGAFETLRWTAGRGAFRSEQHALRLARALEFLHMSTALSPTAFHRDGSHSAARDR